MTRLTPPELAAVKWSRALHNAGSHAGPHMIGDLLAIIDRLTAAGKPGPKKGSRWAPSKVQPCGTNAAYRRHLYHGEEPHEADREAAARYRLAAKRARQGIRP